MLLRLRDVRAGYGALEVLHGVDLDIRPGEMVTILGPNGAGKSVLLKTIAGTLAARGGAIEFAGRSVTRMPSSERWSLGLATLPQTGIVFPAMSVEENLLMGVYAERRRSRARVALDQTYQRYPALIEQRRQPAGSLSGGQQKLVGLARALMGEPKLLLLDEPSIGLDPKSLAAIRGELLALNAAGLTLVLVEQNVSFALSLARRACFLELGRIRRDGPVADFAGPALMNMYFGVAPISHGELQ